MDFEYNKKSTVRKWLEYIGGFVLIYVIAFLLAKLFSSLSSGSGSSVEEYGYFDFVGIGLALIFSAGFYFGYQAGKSSRT